MQQNLFDTPKEKKVIPPNTRCRNCIHMIEHSYNSIMKYCSKQRGNRTATGYKKIGANDVACGMFEAKTVQTCTIP